MEPQRPQEPLTNEQIWGVPDEEMPDMTYEEDAMMEGVLGSGVDEGCPVCGRRLIECQCGGNTWYGYEEDLFGEDLYGED